MPKELLHDHDLICVLGAFIIAKARQQLLDLISYIRNYSTEDINLLWENLNTSLSNEEQEWFRSVLVEEVTNADY